MTLERRSLLERLRPELYHGQPPQDEGFDTETTRLREEGRAALEHDTPELVREYPGRVVVYEGGKRLLITDAANMETALGVLVEAGHKFEQLTIGEISR